MELAADDILTRPDLRTKRSDLMLRNIIPRNRQFVMLEVLEDRRLLSATSFGQSNTAAVTISFAPDGTQVVDQSSNLFENFNGVASTDAWQSAILRAFQTWAVNTNADIGLVDDSGDAFGSVGNVQGDNRFGDIRIGAMPMGPGVMALSIPQDIVSGTWVGDVIFNSDAAFANVDDIFAVAMHEAGNVFGLKDNDNPASPMYSGGVIPPSTTPTTTDLAALDALFGSREMDRNEEEDDRNDTPDDATRLRTSSSNGFDGSTPAAAYGDIGTSSDVDVFRFDPVDDYEGPVTIRVRSAGISQLQPRLSVYDRDGELIGSAESTREGGDIVSVQINEADEGRYYIHVDAASGGVSGIGGYSIVGVFDDLVQSSPQSIDSIAGGGVFRFMEQDQLQDYFVAALNGTTVVVNDDLHLNDTPIGATILETSPGFSEATRYQAFGSFSDSTDVDFYQLESASDPLTVMTARVRGIGGQPLSGDLALVAPDGSEVGDTILVNDGNDFVVQFSSIQADAGYSLRLGPQSAITNYELTVSFDTEPVDITPVGTGTLTPNTPLGLHPLEITEHQIVHFIASSGVPNGGPIDVHVRLRGAAGELLTFTVPSGETRSPESILLPPGNYLVEVQSPIAVGSVVYSVQSVVVSDPLAGLPDDPIDDPISDCGDLPPEACLPGDADGDGSVTFGDFLVLSANFGKSNATWEDGDFDGSTTVGFSDFLILAANFG